jgi:thiamine-monophosphate kinase
MMSEFELIARYFTRPQRSHSAGGATRLGIGDDCALLALTPDMRLAISTDMLVEGRHFFADTDPFRLGHKALAVNLSDLAAMGAKPIAFTLALSLPEVRPEWLQAFAKGMFALADAHNCELVGGDTTRGPLNLCITVFGAVPEQDALRRDLAKTGDDIWVSGSLGDACLGLAALRGEILLDANDLGHARQRLEAPVPRVALGLALRGIAHAAIDLSDGLVGDLGHILSRSQCGASLQVASLPLGDTLARRDIEMQRRFALTGGDDYELCFTAPSSQRTAVETAARTAHTPVTRIGSIEAEPGLRLLDSGGKPLDLRLSSFDHFSCS